MHVQDWVRLVRRWEGQVDGGEKFLMKGKGRRGMFTHNHFCLGLGTVATLWVDQRAKVRETLQGTRDGKNLMREKTWEKGCDRNQKALHKVPATGFIVFYYLTRPSAQEPIPEGLSTWTNTSRCPPEDVADAGVGYRNAV